MLVRSTTALPTALVFHPSPLEPSCLVAVRVRAPVHVCLWVLHCILCAIVSCMHARTQACAHTAAHACMHAHTLPEAASETAWTRVGNLLILMTLLLLWRLWALLRHPLPVLSLPLLRLSLAPRPVLLLLLLPPLSLHPLPVLSLPLLRVSLTPRPVLLLLLLLPLSLHPFPVLSLPVLPLLFLLRLLRPSSWAACLSSSWGCGTRLRAAGAALRSALLLLLLLRLRLRLLRLRGDGGCGGAIEVKPLVQAE